MRLEKVLKKNKKIKKKKPDNIRSADKLIWNRPYGVLGQESLYKEREKKRESAKDSFYYNTQI